MPGQQQQQASAQTPAAKSGSERAPSGESNARNVDGVPRSEIWTHVELRDALDVMPDLYSADEMVAICSRIARRTPGDLPAVRNDAATMTRLYNKLTGDNAARASLYLHCNLIEAVRWQCVAGGIAIGQWSRLVSGRTAQECLDAILSQQTYTVLRNMGGATATEMFPNLTLEPGKFKEAIEGQADFAKWILATDGVFRAMEIMDRLAEYEADKLMREQMVAASIFGVTLALYPRPLADPRQQRRV